MKKWLLISSIVFVLLFYALKLSTKNYASNQANLICSWLHSDSSDIKFSVGPGAFAHLHHLKNTKEMNSCSVAAYRDNFGYKNQVSVLISNINNDLYLVYGSGALKHLFLPRYYQHASTDGHPW